MRSALHLRDVGGSVSLTREAAIAALPAMMQRLYQGSEYYVRIPPGVPRRDFWAPRADPDGAVRNVAREHRRFRGDYSKEIDWICSMAPSIALDVGAGSGRMTRVLTDHGWAVVIVEPDERGFQMCMEERPVDAYPLMSDVMAAGHKEAFDLVTCIHALEHMEDPVSEMRMMADALAPGGHLVVSTPDFDCHTARRFGPRFRLLHDPTHISLLSTDSLLRLVRDVGLEVMAVEWPFWEQERHSHAECLFAQLVPGVAVSPAAPGNVVSVLARKP